MTIRRPRSFLTRQPRLLPHLRRARKRGTDLGYVLHDRGERIGDIKKGFAAACKRAGIEGATPHTLKHTAATWLMQAGTDPWQAAGFLSISVEILLRVYGHHHPDQREAAQNIGRRPRNRVMFPLRSGCFRIRNPHKLVFRQTARSSPKAEVTSSNLVGRASYRVRRAESFLTFS
jgi:hypothetical protein